MVDVFSKIRENNDVKLLLIGDGDVLSGVRDIIEGLNLQDDVILTGAVARDNVQQYISLLDIAVITHSNEFGSPVVMFEFMGLKIPIVAPILMPVTDVLSHQKTAILFEPLDMKQLEISLNELVRDKEQRAKLSVEAYELLMKSHTWKNNAEEIVRSSGVKCN